MNIQYVEGDMFGPLLANKEPGSIVVPHVCNDRGAWGAGFVVPLGRTFPKAKQEYIDWSKAVAIFSGERDEPSELVTFSLGETQIVEVQEGLGTRLHVMGGFGNEHEVPTNPQPSIHVCNMIAQTLGGVRPLFYNHLARCLDTVAKFALKHNSRIMAPMFGSALAGGNWNIIEKLIEDCWLRKGLSATIYYLPGTLPSNWELPETPA
jgi:hypothetical protein